MGADGISRGDRVAAPVAKRVLSFYIILFRFQCMRFFRQGFFPETGKIIGIGPMFPVEEPSPGLYSRAEHADSGEYGSENDEGP